MKKDTNRKKQTSRSNSTGSEYKDKVDMNNLLMSKGDRGNYQSFPSQGFEFMKDHQKMANDRLLKNKLS